MSNSEPESLAVVLAETVASTEALETFADVADGLITEGLDLEVLEGIPIIGAILRLGRVGVGLRDRLFLRNLAAFMAEVATIEGQERLEFAKRVRTDSSFERRTGDAIVRLLDRLDERMKAGALGRAFAAHLEGRIDASEFRRMGWVLDSVELSEIASLRGASPLQNNEPFFFRLAALGLYEASVAGFYGGPQLEYSLSDFGTKCIEILVPSDCPPGSAV